MTDWLSAVSVFFCTEGPAITVSGWTDYFDFEGEDETYSLLKIDGGAEDVEEAKRSGGSSRRSWAAENPTTEASSAGSAERLRSQRDLSVDGIDDEPPIPEAATVRTVSEGISVDRWTGLE